MTKKEYKAKIMSILASQYDIVTETVPSDLIKDVENSFVIKPRKNKGLSFAICVSDFYRNDGTYRDLNDVVAEINRKIDTAMPGGVPIGEIAINDMIKGYDCIRSRIVPSLVSFNATKRRLDTFPYRPFHDMYINYRLFYGAYSTTITNSDEYYLGSIDENQLYEDAMENLKKARVSITHIDGEQAEGTTDAPIYIIRTDFEHCGSNALLNNEALARFANLAGEDFYVFPHSIEELYAIPVSHNNNTDLYELNEEYYSNGNRIQYSRFIYIYRKNTGILEPLPENHWKKIE